MCCLCGLFGVWLVVVICLLRFVVVLLSFGLVDSGCVVFVLLLVCAVFLY